ncbi:MAG TPA: hypothetical protein VJ802_04015 [Gemmatimonadaceae bacterium]|nr:hypothetical protein [Gemmatimonadaceae bacterium]
MPSTSMLTRLALVAILTLTLGCDDDDPIGPGNVTFPDWAAAVNTGFCVRGTAAVGDAKSESISDTDCDFADIFPGGEGFYEIWRIRVASARDVTFDANSNFDNYLAVGRVDAVTATDLDATVIAEDDDRSPPTNLNALITVRLQPNVDYVVVISGFDDEETGAYTLTIR